MLKIKQILLAVLCVVSLSLILSSCKKDRNFNDPLTPGPDVNFYGLTADNKLLLINAKTPSAVTSQVTISGLQTGENILGIDFRPATGQLYGIGSTSRLYVIDQKQVLQGQFLPLLLHPL